MSSTCGWAPPGQAPMHAGCQAPMHAGLHAQATWPRLAMTHMQRNHWLHQPVSHIQAPVLSLNPWAHSAHHCSCRKQHRRWCRTAAGASGSASIPPADNGATPASQGATPDSDTSSPAASSESGNPQHPAAKPGFFQMLKQEWQEVDESLKGWDPEQEVQQQRQLLAQRLQQFRQPATPSDTRTQAGDEPSSSSAPVAQPFYKWPLVTYALFGWTWVLLYQQWAPLLEPLLSPAASASELVVKLLGVLLLVPNTQICADWQLDLLAWAAGEVPWTAPLSAAALHSGLLPTLVFTRGLLDAGSVIEGAYGPLVLCVHLAVSAWMSGALQLLLNPVPVAITGPGVVCGLYCGLAVLLAREQHMLRQKSGAAVVAEGDDDDDDDQLSSRLLSIPVISRPAIASLVCALLLAWFQPMLGIWGVVGGCVGGCIAGLTSVYLVKVFALGVLSTFNFAIRFLLLLLRLPMFCFSFMSGLLMWLVSSVKEAVQGFRRM